MSAVLHSKNKDFCAKKGSQQIKWSTKNHHEKMRCVTNEGKNWEKVSLRVGNFSKIEENFCKKSL